MDAQVIQNIAIAVISGLIPSLIAARANNKKTLAEAKKVSAESREIDVSSLSEKLTTSTMKLISKMEEKVARLEKKCAERDEKINKYATKVIELKGTVSDIATENAQLKRRIEEQDVLIEEANKSAERMTARIRLLQRELDNVTAELEHMADLNLEYRNGIMILLRQLEGVGIKPNFVLEEEYED